MLTVLLALTIAAPPDAKPREVLLKKLEQSTENRPRLVLAIAQLQRPDCEATLRKHLKDEDQSVQFNAMYGLLLLGQYDSSMKKVLLDTTRTGNLEGPSLLVHFEALKESGRDFGEPAADLVSLIESETENTRMAALTNYTALGCRNAKVVPALVTVLKSGEGRNSERFLKGQACMILMAIGKEAGGAQSALEDLLNHSTHLLSGCAAVALLQQDPNHLGAMKHLKAALYSTDLSQARPTASAFAMVPESLAALDSHFGDLEFFDFKSDAVAWPIARAFAKSGVKHEAVEKWLIRSLDADSLLLRMDASIAFSTLYPDQRDKITNNVRFAFAGKSFTGSDLLADHLATVVGVPAEIAKIANEKYAAAGDRAGPALAMVALKADPTDRDAEAFLHKCLADDPKKDREVDRAVAARIVGNSGPIGKRFRDDLIRMLEGDQGFPMDEAAVALRKLDAHK